jgi:predicted ATPase
MRLLEQLTLTHLLSFGGASEPLEFTDLTVVIGANGSGKSNLLEAVDLLRNVPDQVTKPVRDGGGIREWLWKGADAAPTAHIEAVLANPRGRVTADGRISLRYSLSFTAVGLRLEIVDEKLENSVAYPGEPGPYCYYRYENGRPVLNVSDGKRYLRREDIDVARSILAQRRDPDQYPEITRLADTLPKIMIFREWSFGRYAPARMPQRADLPNGALSADAGNLGLVINRLRRDPAVKERLLSSLKQLYDGIDDFDVQIEADAVQVFFHEDRMTIPAARLSDGTLRYLCLLAILFDPDPPPLICIEEPELGLHPDVISTLAALLKDASARCQLIVTTHSTALVDAMTDSPEDVVVCEKVDGATRLKRLSAADLSIWLDRYRLGDLWTSGEIGGNRW